MCSTFCTCTPAWASTHRHARTPTHARLLRHTPHLLTKKEICGVIGKKETRESVWIRIGQRESERGISHRESGDQLRLQGSMYSPLNILVGVCGKPSASHALPLGVDIALLGQLVPNSDLRSITAALSTERKRKESGSNGRTAGSTWLMLSNGSTTSSWTSGIVAKSVTVVIASGFRRSLLRRRRSLGWAESKGDSTGLTGAE